MTPQRNLDQEHTWIRWAELTIVVAIGGVVATSGWKGWPLPTLLALCLLTVLLIMGGKIHEARSLHNPSEYNSRTSQKILSRGDEVFLLTTLWAFLIVATPLLYKVLKWSGAK